MALMSMTVTALIIQFGTVRPNAVGEYITMAVKLIMEVTPRTRTSSLLFSGSSYGITMRFAMSDSMRQVPNSIAQDD